MIKIKQIKKHLNKILWFVAKYSTILFLLLFFLALILGGFAFYQYSFLSEKSEPRFTIKSLKFEEFLYEEILREWVERQENFEETKDKIYPNLFKPQPIIKEPPFEEPEPID